MVKDFLVSSTLDLILLLFPNTYGPNPGLYKKSLTKFQKFLKPKYQKFTQGPQIPLVNRVQASWAALRVPAVSGLPHLRLHLLPYLLPHCSHFWRSKPWSSRLEVQYREVQSPGKPLNGGNNHVHPLHPLEHFPKSLLHRWSWAPALVRPEGA